MQSLQGQLLIAAPSLLDPNFAQTVVLVAVHGQDGALGLILNREMNTPLQQVWDQISESKCIRLDNVRHGGPVSGTLMVLHDQRPHANLIVADDLYVATELDAMEALAGAEDVRALFYVGHSGWGAGQLENELVEGSWLVLPATTEHIFGGHDPLTLWKDSMTEVGRRQVHSVIPVKHLPEDPRLN